MHYRTLGRTGLSVSALSFGTVSLGIDYGIISPGDYGRPGMSEAVQLLRHAANAGGINLFDTAPVYGESERILGTALGSEKDCLFATKISLPVDEVGRVLPYAQLRQSIHASIEGSLRNLQRDYLDIVQIHNATSVVIQRGEVANLLLELQQQGKVRYLGASIYTEEEALAVIAAGCFDLLQLPFSILDQRPSARVLSAAATAGVAILNRSALLKGVLSAKAQWLPPELVLLQQGAQRVVSALDLTWDELPALALRFCLSVPEISSVLIGARTTKELEQALAAEACGGLCVGEFALGKELALDVGDLLNPATWPVT